MRDVMDTVIEKRKAVLEYIYHEVCIYRSGKTKLSLLKRIFKKQQDAKFKVDAGICVNYRYFYKKFYNEDDRLEDWATPIIANWSKYSGNSIYPVPDINYIPAEAYIKNGDRLWANNAYGNDRTELLFFLIQCLR